MFEPEHRIVLFCFKTSFMGATQAGMGLRGGQEVWAHVLSGNKLSVCMWCVRACCPGGWGRLGVLVVVREAALLGSVLICGVFLEVLC